MTTLLTDNLPLLAGAPNGIKKLRELILELAVCGKLVEQDASDEPASELLKRIAAEKTRLVAEGKIKKQKPLAEISEDELPYSAPSAWEWVRLDALLTKIGAGSTPLGGKQAYVNEGVKFLRSQNVWNEGLYLDDVAMISEATHQKMQGTHVGASDLLFNITGASIGRCAVVPDDFDTGNVSQHVTIIRPLAKDLKRFLHLVLISPLLQQTVMDVQVGVSREGLSIGKLAQFVIPFPPEAEQHRIVAKVDELMALCDRLEAQQADAASAHAQLVQALLGSLTQASDATEFAANWQRLAEHFHSLFSTEPSIDALKQTLLQLAVMGKLVPQDPTDEPASELLKRIQAEKHRLVAEGKLKKQKPLAPIDEDEKPYELPPQWQWSRLGSHVIESGAGWSPSCEPRRRDGKEWGVLKVSAVSWGLYRPEENKALPAGLDPRPEHEVAEGDFLVSRANTAELVARSVVVENTPVNLMLSDKIVRLKLTSLCDRRYVNFVNSSTFAREYYGRVAAGTSSSMKNVSREQILSLLIPLPPLAEQHRIVAKLDQLMALCDQLKTQLSQARQLNGQLASTLVERALVDGNKVTATVIDQGKARTLLAAEIVQELHCEKRMGRVKLQKIISLAEHVAQLKEIQSDEQRYAAGPHDPALMNQVAQGLRAAQWFEELALEAEVGKRYEYRPLAQMGAHRPAYEALWSAQQRRQISELIELMRLWDTPRCERVATLYSAWNDLLIEDREATETAILHEVLHGWNDSKLKFTEAQWLAELVEMKQHSFLIPTGFGKRTTGGVLSLPGFE